MCSACCLIVIYICVKFRENIEWTRVHTRWLFSIATMFKGLQLQKQVIRVMVFVFCILSDGALHL